MQTQTQSNETLPFDLMRMHGFGGDPNGVPLVVQPKADRSVDTLVAWIEQHSNLLEGKRYKHGALLFRGFDVTGPDDFERVSRAIDPGLQNEYLGTSPRNPLTEYVFRASELPGYYPIPQHCEMTFTGHPPRSLFFCCLTPCPVGGETPLVDFRKVLRDMDPAVRKRFEEGGIKVIRNYVGPEEAHKRDLWKLKRWDEMFGTTDRAEIEAKCAEEGFTPIWGEKGRLRLVSTQPAIAKHPITGDEAWWNHSQVFHMSAAPGEYKRIFAKRRDPKFFALWQFSRAMVAVRRRITAPEEQPMHVTYQDGREISDADMEHVRDLIWKHMVAYKWRQGDVCAIDNHSTSHGRLPYEGPRFIAAAWA